MAQLVFQSNNGGTGEVKVIAPSTNSRVEITFPEISGTVTINGQDTVHSIYSKEISGSNIVLNCCSTIRCLRNGVRIIVHFTETLSSSNLINVRLGELISGVFTPYEDCSAFIFSETAPLQIVSENTFLDMVFYNGQWNVIRSDGKPGEGEGVINLIKKTTYSVNDKSEIDLATAVLESGSTVPVGVPVDTSNVSGTANAKVVLTTDKRLSDSRDPKTHTHAFSSLTWSSESETIPLKRIPQGAIAKLKIVDTEANRLALTIKDVQNGDTVKVTATNLMYYVKDETKLAPYSNPSEAFEVYKAGEAAAVSWVNVYNKPNTFTPSTHAHGNISNDGRVGSISGLPLITGNNGLVTTGSSTTYAPYTHTHKQSEITGLTDTFISKSDANASFAPKSHSQDSGSISNLQNDSRLQNTFANRSHSHTISQITDYTPPGKASTSSTGVVRVGDTLTINNSSGILNIKDTGVSAGTSGPSEDGQFVIKVGSTGSVKSVSGSFKVPYFTVDGQGRITNRGERTLSFSKETAYSDYSDYWNYSNYDNCNCTP